PGCLLGRFAHFLLILKEVLIVEQIVKKVRVFPVVFILFEILVFRVQVIGVEIAHTLLLLSTRNEAVLPPLGQGPSNDAHGQSSGVRELRSPGVRYGIKKTLRTSLATVTLPRV